MMIVMRRRCLEVKRLGLNYDDLQRSGLKDIGKEL